MSENKTKWFCCRSPCCAYHSSPISESNKNMCSDSHAWIETNADGRPLTEPLGNKVRWFRYTDRSHEIFTVSDDMVQSYLDHPRFEQCDEHGRPFTEPLAGGLKLEPGCIVECVNADFLSAIEKGKQYCVDKIIRYRESALLILKGFACTYYSERFRVVAPATPSDSSEEMPPTVLRARYVEQAAAPPDDASDVGEKKQYQHLIDSIRKLTMPRDSSSRTALHILSQLETQIASDNYATLQQLREEVERLKPYETAIRSTHNGYKAEARRAMPGLKEPASPEQAIKELFLESDDLECTNVAAFQTRIAELEQQVKAAADIVAEHINKNSIHSRDDHSQNCAWCKLDKLLRSYPSPPRPVESGDKPSNQ